jgi:hypothetical protein
LDLLYEFERAGSTPSKDRNLELKDTKAAIYTQHKTNMSFI